MQSQIGKRCAPVRGGDKHAVAHAEKGAALLFLKYLSQKIPHDKSTHAVAHECQGFAPELFLIQLLFEHRDSIRNGATGDGQLHA
jgi:hypothetical protein